MVYLDWRGNHVMPVAVTILVTRIHRISLSEPYSKKSSYCSSDIVQRKLKKSRVFSTLWLHYGVTWTLDYTITFFKPARWKVHISSLRRKPLKDHGFVGYPIDYRVALGFGSISGGLDHVYLVIRLPLEHGISRVLGKDEHSNLRTMAGVDINTLTMEQYLALSRENHAPGVVKPEIRDNVNFKIKSQFMRELREDTFSENKNEDPMIMLIESSTLWMDKRTPGAVNTWDLLKKAFIQSSNIDGLTAIVSKLDNLGRNMKKLKENVHAIQVGCQIYEGPHLDKECPLNEEVK
ncbi:hypothetical protein Tco_1012040 [Tanacetum coccineum]